MAWHKIFEPEPEDFDPTQDYTPAQLDAFATAFLRRDRKVTKEATGKEPEISILFDEQLYNRSKREIPVNALEIDDEITNNLRDPDQRPGSHKGDGQRIFSRSHPRGRKVNTPEQRARGSSYYSN